MDCSRKLTLLGFCTVALAGPIHAQPSPDRPIRLVVAAAPATTTDEQVRALLPSMSATLNRAVIADHRGANFGILASETVARADPNGNTLLLGNSTTHAALPALNDHLAYDPLRDFVAITQLTRTGMVVVAHSRLPPTTVVELSRYAKTASKTLQLGNYDAVQQAAGEGLGRHLGIPLNAVMHKNSIAAMQALTGGLVDLALLAPYVARAPVHAGRLKALGITGAERSSVLPEVATLAEQGIEGYDLPSWEGLFAPAGTPAAILSAVHRSAVDALNADDARRLYLELGITPVGSSPTEFAAVLRHDVATYRRIVGRGKSPAK